MSDYNFKSIEKKWSDYWQKNETYKVVVDTSKPKYYILDMFPYPSGDGLHVGHPLGYIASDILARYKKLKGFNVLHPMGFDSFGLPAEQYAIDTGQHPETTTKKNIKRYKEQLTLLGLSFDWSKEVQTSDPKYYKWTQWIFSLIFNSWYDNDANKTRPIDALLSILEKDGNHGLSAACNEDTPIISSNEWKGFSNKEKHLFLLNYRMTYLAETNVNWCPKLGTVLSNDEVKDGFSERGGYPVIKKKMNQWNMRITAYAERLLEGLEKIEWPNHIKTIQKNWIGKSVGVELSFVVENSFVKIPVFTTRIDTIFGVTFIVIAPESELTLAITTEAHRCEIEQYIETVATHSEQDRTNEVKKMTGVFSGSMAVHPLSKKKIPIWISDYVLAEYGTGAIMAVPSGDQRDFNFAKTFDLPIITINDQQKITDTHADATKKGKLINSDFLNGLEVSVAIQKATEEVEKRKIGQSKINYRMRDAIFGRQRYWGEPIPIYYDTEKIPTLLNENELPLVLPPTKKFTPTNEGDPPLGRVKGWKHNQFEYELSTMPGWAGSSWYFFRYMDPENDIEFCSKKSLTYWQKVDVYLGGSEHATGHLLYSRFWTKVLYDLGYVPVDEYAKKLVNQGMIQGQSSIAYRVNEENKYVSLGHKDKYKTSPIHVNINFVKNNKLDIERFKNFRPDAKDAIFELEDGIFYCDSETEKMSKSKMNVVNPDALIEKYGADTFRMYEMFLGPITQSKPWNTNGIEGVYKFIRKFWSLFHQEREFYVSSENPTEKELAILHSSLKKVSSDIEKLSHNTCVSTFMIAINELKSLQCNKRSILSPLVIAITPFAPFLAEELWFLLGNKSSVTDASFPTIEEKFLKQDTVTYPISINGKVRSQITVNNPCEEETLKKLVLEEEIIKKWLNDRIPKKIIIVPNKIINIVV